MLRLTIALPVTIATVQSNAKPSNDRVYSAQRIMNAVVEAFNKTNDGYEMDESEICNSKQLRLEYRIDSICKTLGLVD